MPTINKTDRSLKVDFKNTSLDTNMENSTEQEKPYNRLKIADYHFELTAILRKNSR